MATIIGALPVNILNGTTEDALQVMADFNFIVQQVNANGLARANNLSDIVSAATARTNLGLGTVALLNTAGLIGAQLFLNTAVYTKTAGTSFISPILLGGGAGGGGSKTTSASQIAAGSGGYAGEIRQSVRVAVAAFNGLTLTVGAGGVGVVGLNGTAGGNTTFGSITAVGGNPGAVGAAFANTALFPNGVQAAASGSGGQIGSGTFPGDYGLYLQSFAIGGKGGSCSPYGAGGAAVTANGNGNAGTGRGSGGSGSTNIAFTTADHVGGNGAEGFGLVLEYSQ